LDQVSFALARVPIFNLQLHSSNAALSEKDIQLYHSWTRSLHAVTMSTGALPANSARVVHPSRKRKSLETGVLDSTELVIKVQRLN
jgi:hypothetical protein